MDGKDSNRSSAKTERKTYRTTKRKSLARFSARFQLLKDHHEKCLSKYTENEKHHIQSSGLPLQEKENTSSQEMSSELIPDSNSWPSGRSHEEKSSSESPPEVLAPCNSLETSSSSEKIPTESSSSVSVDPEVPPLERTDSVFLTYESLELLSKTPAKSEASKSCMESSGDEYCPSTDSTNEGSGDDYFPSKDSVNESSSDVSCDPESKASPVKLKRRKKFIKTYSRKTVSSKLPSQGERVESGHSRDTNSGNMSVLRLQKKRDGARVYKKKRYCLYCPLHCHKMARHLIRKHSNEPALQTLREAKWNTPSLLPFTEDVKMMHMHLDKCREEYQKTLKKDPNKRNWSKLATLTLCEVILFNRRREGEVSKMPLSAFTLRDTTGVHSDLAEGLSPLEQKLCQHFQRIEIRGKRNRKVPILLTPDMLSSMEALVAYRRACGTPDENPFFFSRPEAETHLRGSDAIRLIAKECGAKHPETLSSTKLRKQISTLSTVLNLKDHEMDIMANFLGHDIRVHRQFYRLPEGTMELAKVSKVLCALEQGRLSEFKGMSLDQIHISPNEQVLEAGDSEVSDMETEKDSCLRRPSSESSGGNRKTPSSECGEDTLSSGIPQTHAPYNLPCFHVHREILKQIFFLTASSTPRRPHHVESDCDDAEGPSEAKRQTVTSITDDSEEGTQRCNRAQRDESSVTESSKRRSWTPLEVRAVEKTLKLFLDSGKVPGKADCVDCIKASPQELKTRTWKAVKYYIKNQITAVQRESARRY
ncbi:uncharacterized protein LOC114455202 isoform X5 [Gouania willdenowi]|uniref:uncharacterized protein LOC114455202 isoform X5 n=1 Tax=Gouania willdenowi TaxID=441366 RepID=UPI001055572E|nr:uncharacterized protein LOC114455202 isoform X5 [Gouania willdenowi]